MNVTNANPSLPFEKGNKMQLILQDFDVGKDGDQFLLPSLTIK